MSRYRNKKKIIKVICRIIIGALFLTGCSGTGQEPEAESRKKAAWSVWPSQEGTESTDRGSTAKEILEYLIKDDGFRERVWYDSDINDDDTEEIILQKLNQCEGLVLREPPYGNETFSLEDLKLLPNLKSLTIDFSEFDTSRISDFTPIAGLSQLEWLYISYPAREEIEVSFLSEMETVTELFLCNCQIEDISFLGNMTWLERLSLYGTPIENFAVLEKLTGLVELSLAYNAGAEHIETVGKLLKLEDLGLQDCGIKDIGFLGSLKELREVNLNNNSITDLTPLAGLTKLERLGLAGNEISDITPISGLSELFDLFLDGNKLKDISALTNLCHLNQLGLSDNQIQDFSPLAEKAELLYVSVYGNPCTDLEPVIMVPLLHFSNGEISDGQLEVVAEWMKKYRPDVEEYQCIDYLEKDLNGDGVLDAAFVVNGSFMDGDGILAYNDERRVFVLVRQKDGSWQDIGYVIRISDPSSGGMRGDPYRGMLLGEGCLYIKSEWGSSTGCMQTDIYNYRKGGLELSRSIAVSDSNFAYGYDVTEYNAENAVLLRYVIAMDNDRLVRIDLANSEYPAHKAFPELELYTESYVIYREKKAASMDAVKALDSLLDFLSVDAVQEKLPYAIWQKESYELLKGVELPDYYYLIQNGEKTPDGETWEQTGYIYYNDLIVSDGEYFHVIRYVEGKREKEYLVNDTTGEIIMRY